jgi:hypothetical protein
MVNHRTAGVIGDLARQRVAGKPHNVTELQFCSPNDYVAEGPLLTAAYAGLQDWDSLWFFEYRTDETEFTSGFFDHAGHPGRLVNTLLAAALFRRGDVKPAEAVSEFAFDPETELEMAATRGSAWYISHGAHLGIPAALSMTRRIALRTDPGAPLTAIPPAPTATVFTSDTGELKWDHSRANQSVITIDTPLTKAVLGFHAGRVFDLGGVRIEPGRTERNWSTIGLTLLDGAQWNGSEPARGLIVATAGWANTDMEWKDATRTSLGSRWGRAPSLIETVAASITLPVPAARLKLWSLDARGQRLAEAVVAATEEGGSRFALAQSGVTLWYEFEITAP